MILEANGNYYTTTLHAEEKMLLAKVAPEQIVRVIEEGKMDYTETGEEFYRLKIGGREIGVVIADEERIITIFVIE